MRASSLPGGEAAHVGWRWLRSMCVAAAIGVLLPAGLEGQLRRTGSVAAEVRGFFNEPLQDVQARHSAAIALQPEFSYGWDRRRQSVTFEPFIRIDFADNERTHLDVRELAWERAWRDWALRVGVRTVFWGVTESAHLVDVINQTDFVENLDGEDKLGQPMINLAAIRNWGTIDLFVLPGFRERTFPGEDGRLRFPAVVSDEPQYVSDAEQARVDLAARWSHFIGAFDLGASYFWGTDRDPRFLVSSSGPSPLLVPRYDVVHQFGLDVQYTTGPWLWKAEGITREGREQDLFYSFVGGFERTLYQIAGSDADLGLILEYLYHDRGDEALTPFANDVFVGGRLALNDVQSTELLGGGIVDAKTGSALVRLEGSRRVGSSWTADLEVAVFVGIEPEELFYGLRSDDFLSVTVTRWF